METEPRRDSYPREESYPPHPFRGPQRHEERPRQSRVPTHPADALDPLESITATLTDLHRGLAELKAAQAEPDTPPRPVRAWVANNLAWLLSGVIGLGIGSIKLRDEWRDRNAEADRIHETQAERIHEAHDATAQNAANIEAAEKRLGDAIVQSRVLTVEGLDQVLSTVRDAHPRADVPADSPALAKAKKKAREERAKSETLGSGR